MSFFIASIFFFFESRTKIEILFLSESIFFAIKKSEIYGMEIEWFNLNKSDGNFDI